MPFYRYFWEIQIFEVKKRFLIRGQTGVFSSPMAIMFCIECIISFVHVPPGIESKATPELQMIPLIRFYQVVKLLKEHNELRYHRLTNVLTRKILKICKRDFFPKNFRNQRLNLKLSKFALGQFLPRAWNKYCMLPWNKKALFQGSAFHEGAGSRNCC